MGNVTLNLPGNWFALQVRSRWESKTASLLSGKGFETILPTYDRNRGRADRERIVKAPLFPGYLFCRFDVHNRLPVLITPGVISVVGMGKTPIAVEESEIDAIQRVVLSGIKAQPWPYLEIGERVRIDGDVLGGMEGILTSFKGRQRVIISVTLLRRSVALELDRARIHPICSTQTAKWGPMAAFPALGKAIA
jgi:transcription antitermination factor NusG